MKKVIDLINESRSTAFSFEILPPLRGNSIQKVYNVIDKLREFDPKYINITAWIQFSFVNPIHIAPVSLPGHP